MATPSKKAKLNFLINGQEIEAPENWQDVEILATFENDSTQANLSTDSFSFVLSSRNEILQHITNGLSGGVGIFEGIPFSIQLANITDEYTGFEGYLDLTEEFKEDQTNGRVQCSIKKANGLNSFEERLGALSYGYLESIGLFNNSYYETIKYVEEKPLNAFEILVSAIMLYLMIKELIEAIKTLVDFIANQVAHAGGGVTGPIASLAFTILSILALVIYIIAILITIIQLTEKLIATFIPPARKAKVMRLDIALIRVCEHLGYNFETTIDELSEIYYIPSNPNLDVQNDFGFIAQTRGPQKGIPNAADYGYGCIEMFNLAKDLFYAKYTIKGNTVHFDRVDDSQFSALSTYTLPDVLPIVKQYNTDEFAANRILQFDTDISDTWTIDEFSGTNYEVITDAINVNNVDAKYLKGLDQVRFPVCLGSRKNKLNPLEDFLKIVGGGIDAITKLFGKQQNVAKKMKGKVGLLRVSTNNYSKPKVLKLKNGKLTTNHRETWSAKYLYDNYHNSKSFVSNNYFGQKTVFRSVRIPFGFSDFLKLIDNSYFNTADGKEGKFISLKWRIDADYAIVDYWIREPYTKNLKEIFVQP